MCAVNDGWSPDPLPLVPKSIHSKEEERKLEEDLNAPIQRTYGCSTVFEEEIGEVVHKTPPKRQILPPER
jgi:hypothetical protein